MYSYNSSDIPLNQWTNVTVSQTYANSTSKYTFAIEIDGTEVHSLENTRAQQFFGVKEYWSNPWADAALANVDNVTVLTSRGQFSWKICSIRKFLMTVLKNSSDDFYK